MIGRLLLLTFLAILFEASPSSAAFEILTDPEGDWLLNSSRFYDVSGWQVYLNRADRYGLAELGVNSVGVSLNRNPGDNTKGWRFGVRLSSSGDDLYRENRAVVEAGAIRLWYGTSVQIRGGVQSLRIRGYADRSQPVSGASIQQAVWNRMEGEIGVDGVPLPVGNLQTAAASPVGWISFHRWLDKEGIAVGCEFRPNWQPQMFVRFGSDLGRGIYTRLMWRDRPGRVGGAIEYALDHYLFTVSYVYQPILGATRRLGLGFRW